MVRFATLPSSSILCGTMLLGKYAWGINFRGCYGRIGCAGTLHSFGFPGAWKLYVLPDSCGTVRMIACLVRRPAA